MIYDAESSAPNDRPTVEPETLKTRNESLPRLIDDSNAQCNAMHSLCVTCQTKSTSTLGDMHVQYCTVPRFISTDSPFGWNAVVADNVVTIHTHNLVVVDFRSIPALATVVHECLWTNLVCRRAMTVLHVAVGRIEDAGHTGIRRRAFVVAAAESVLWANHLDSAAVAARGLATGAGGVDDDI
ncbi:hypothetical protein T310_2569 [Rasamsonia emersonii CBS 393.64]|uniref:Uncharacterized protein n=1 Tax=Rasamsonia emersonii (strain ATCC 16479 / CBS 393.64 / IMI 116815) TaxID=1408163 RepID=A0A0F4YZX5_RASE3|nr:hypothetical protein T310_2569 [Rasamsonia emersonii CBS 393.64]KKA23396.1 hypothetical protein T310_2569 [Rasamsonia emersonii CBS 393.64]